MKIINDKKYMPSLSEIYRWYTFIPYYIYVSKLQLSSAIYSAVWWKYDGKIWSNNSVWVSRELNNKFATASHSSEFIQTWKV